MNRHIPTAAAVLAMVAALAACGEKEESPWSQITPVPTTANPPTFTMRWETGGTPPTDPRERAVWDYNIEMLFADNTNDYTRPQLRASATDGVVKRRVEIAIGNLYGFDGTPAETLGVYAGPLPVVFQKVQRDSNPNNGFDWVYYCEGPENHATATPSALTGNPFKIAVTQGADDKWRVNGIAMLVSGKDSCSLEGASIGYYEPRPQPLAPGTYSLADLRAPEWALPDEWREAVGKAPIVR